MQIIWLQHLPSELKGQALFLPFKCLGDFSHGHSGLKPYRLGNSRRCTPSLVKVRQCRATPKLTEVFFFRLEEKAGIPAAGDGDVDSEPGQLSLDNFSLSKS